MAEQHWLLASASEQRLVGTHYDNGGVPPETAIDAQVLGAFTQAAVPPLRERRDDIRELVSLFWTGCNHVASVLLDPLRDDEVAELVSRDWPGNARELRNVITVEHARRCASMTR